MSAGGESFAMRQSFKQKNDDELIIRVDVVGPDGSPAEAPGRTLPARRRRLTPGGELLGARATVSRRRFSCARSSPVGSLAAKSSASNSWRISTTSPAANGARLIHSMHSSLVVVCSSQ